MTNVTIINSNRKITVDDSQYDNAVADGFSGSLQDWKNSFALGPYDNVFVIGGQSNADGRGALPSAKDHHHSKAMLYTKDSEITSSSEPASRTGNKWINNIPEGNTSTNGTKFSFVTPMAKALVSICGISPVMVPCAIGSTSLDDWLPPTTEGDMTSLFGAMVSRTNEAVNGVLNGPIYNKPTFVWYGHESGSADTSEDLSTGDIGSTYMTKWATHVSNIRERFPDSVMLYAQLATAYTGSVPSGTYRVAECQRRAESDYGSTLGNYAPVWEDAPYGLARFEKFASANTNGTNFAIVESGKLHLIADGSTILEGATEGLVVDAKYKMTVNVTGSGLWKFLSGPSQVGSTRSPGVSVIEFTGDDYAGSDGGTARFLRGASGQAADLVFEITELLVDRGASSANSYMVVTHDVPRNAAPDDIHVGTEGHKEIGRRFALCYAQRVLGMTWINGTGPRLVSITKPTTSTVKVKFNKTILANSNGYGVNLASSLFRVYDNGVEKTLSECVIDPSDSTAVKITTSTSNSGTVVVTYGDRPGPSDTSWRQGVVYDTDNLPAPMFGPIVAS